MSNTKKDCCKWCKKFVRPRQKSIQCDGCENWQHGTCDTGISREVYRVAVGTGKEQEWGCEDCLNMSAGFLLPNAESTRLDENICSKYDQLQLTGKKSIGKMKTALVGMKIMALPIREKNGTGPAEGTGGSYRR